MTPHKIAILIDPDDRHSPSDSLALDKFKQAAIDCGLEPEFIYKEDFSRLKDFKALFIRTMTAESHYSMQFILAARHLGLVCLDDPVTVFYGSNKYNYYQLLLNRVFLKDIKVPDTICLWDLYFDWELRKKLRFPLVCKTDTGFFCENVFKLNSQEEFEATLQRKGSTLYQEFIPTDFDWRICVLNDEILFACKYWMVKDHWQIAKYSNDSVTWGDVECVDLDHVPYGVLELAVKSTRLISKRGLFGVDIKYYNGSFYLIEVNDDPNIEAGFEDKLLGDKIYLDIMRCYAAKLEEEYAFG
jgi:glutathione synthase/RimK-type ligase-like ATP-grasp enzyme